jgi:hypothetical protein
VSGRARKHLRAEQLRLDADHPELGLRLTLMWLVQECVLPAFDDISTSKVVETYRIVLGHLDDRTQTRTGSALETASLEAVARLRSPLAQVAASAERHAARDETEAEGPLLIIPAETLMPDAAPGTPTSPWPAGTRPGRTPTA